MKKEQQIWANVQLQHNFSMFISIQTPIQILYFDKNMLRIVLLNMFFYFFCSI